MNQIITKNRWVKKQALRIAIFVLVLAEASSLMTVKPAEAQLTGSAACNASVMISQAVPVFDQNTQIQKNVKCTWDGIGWQLAHVALHQLTGSIVNWINSGFKGSPSFISNPEAFFMNLNDQVVGAFVGNSGILAQALCSPFSNNIRLALALGAQQQGNQQYTCTLSKIIQTQTGNFNRLQQNNFMPNVTVTQTSNGATLGNFINGSVLNGTQIGSNGVTIGQGISQTADQGNWGGFLLMYEPQNNWISATLMARSDLGQQIAAHQNSVNNDLNRGNGFLSWQSCKQVPTTDPANDKRQVCTVQTPGSYINDALVSAVGQPANELNLTNEINEVVSALFSQLLTHTLNNGLLSASHASASSKAYTDLLNNDPNLEQNFLSLQKQVIGQYQDSLSALNISYGYESQAADIIGGEISAFRVTEACLAAAATSTSSNASQASQALLLVSNTITNTLTPLETSYAISADNASSSIQLVENVIAQLDSATTTQALSDMANQFSQTLSAESFGQVPDPQTAKADVSTANSTVSGLKKDLNSYQNLCSSGNTYRL